MSTPWGKVYGDLWRHEKWVGLSKGAKALWTSAFSWSKESKTYGKVPGHLLFIFDGLPEEAAELVEVELWHQDGSDYVFHDWDERQESLQKHRDVSEKRAAAGRKSGEKRRSQRKAGTNGNTTRTSAEQTGTPVEQTPPPEAGREQSEQVPSTPSEVLFPLVEDGSRNKRELEREREREREFSTTRSSGRSKTPGFVYPDAFELWWKAYPRKDDKRKALPSWKTATRSVPNETLIAAAERYRDDPNRDEAFTKLPTTWLNGHCWENGPLPPRPGGGGNRPQAGDTHRAMQRSYSAAQSYRALEESGYYDHTPQISMRRTA